VSTAGFAVVVSQRLKERATVMHKLVRYPRMQLHTMPDVAGCRAVGEGPVELLERLVVLADIYGMQSQGLTVPDSMMQLGRLRRRPQGGMSG
jgi:hypothetical protein